MLRFSVVQDSSRLVFALLLYGYQRCFISRLLLLYRYRLCPDIRPWMKRLDRMVKWRYGCEQGNGTVHRSEHAQASRDVAVMPSAGNTGFAWMMYDVNTEVTNNGLGDVICV